ncbi:hypothetical protein EYF80_029191 [Liparis tanakae]|uniref:Secreted protein n=1 Tax=Liparis tanakae TaxID=230148 RepID=A0A4Z2H537_9TELE|nr:hypothetical protein EYF80_029191 [Liparis tanakae]
MTCRISELVGISSLAHLLFALSPSPWVAGGRERYTSSAERPLRLKSCRLLISLSRCKAWPHGDRAAETGGRAPCTSSSQESL